MPCVEHTQKGSKFGYGKARLFGKVTTLHRAVYSKHHNLTAAQLSGLVIRHTCDNPRCINVEHLVMGTELDNINDKLSRNRQSRLSRTTNPSNVLTEEQVAYIRANYKPYCKDNGSTPLGKRFGVHPSTISKVANNQSFKE